LFALGQELVLALEWISADLTLPIPDAVYERVLPRIEPLFATIERLRDVAVDARRRAAGELRAAAANTGLPDLAVDRLVAIATLETDELVLIAVLVALESDPRVASIQLAAAAIGHAAPEVRRLAVEHLGRFGAGREAKLLLTALDDPYAPVVMAAVRSLGKPGMLDDTIAIERLLSSPNRAVQLEAAAVLVGLGASAGADALERLARDVDPKTRRQAVERMGASGSARFTPILVELLAEGQGVGPAALAALPACAGRDVCREQGLGPADRQAQVGAWRAWWQVASARGVDPSTGDLVR
jgi:hypothetical protein